ncbi:MAG TPA: PIN domain-containing protein, partial [Promineifilum sp.]|nr:PIN domain-containing protein [Promineifilum sp.]
MSKSLYLLDTSAIMTFLEDEEGAARVEDILRREEVLLPFLALLETYYITLQEQPMDVADKRYALLKQLPATILWDVDEPTLLTAGQLKAAYRLSLA